MRAATVTACVLLLLGYGLYHVRFQIGTDQIVADDNAPGVRAAILSESTWDRFAPEGKEVDAIFGDIVLQNEYLTAVIAQPLASRNANMTVRDVAGGLIDLTANSPQSDQLSAFYPGQRAFPYRSWTVNDADGNERNLTEAPLQGEAASVTVHAEGGDGRLQVDTTYTLRQGSRWISVTSVFRNVSDAAIDTVLQDDIRCDGQKEQMVKSPNGEGEFYFIADQFWGQAYGLTAGEHAMQFNNTDARRSDIKYLANEGGSTVTVAPGDSYRLTRYLTAGATQLHVAEAFSLRAGDAATPVQLFLRDENQRPIVGGVVTLHPQGDDHSNFAGVVHSDDAGAVTVPLAPGHYLLDLTFNGQVVLENHPLQVDANVEQEELIVVDGHHPGTLQVAVTDGEGREIPCKVQIAGVGDTPTPNFGPDTAVFGVRNLRYTPNGQFSQPLPPGQYALIASHGPEYDAVFAEVEVTAGETTDFSCELVRSVDTTGWISSDFHSHASPSGDNTSSQLGRVLNLVCEHIEFAPCTEHNRVSTYQPHIDSLRIAPFLSSCSGIELTGSPLPLNHQNAFPLEHTHHHQDGGGPVTDTDIETQVERLALWDNRSEKLIQQNHPDLGWLIYDRDGDGEYDDGHAGILPHIDVIEVHPVESALTLQPFRGERNDTLFNWLQMLNDGKRYPGVINTDAHYNFHGSGWARNWIRCDTDDPAAIDVMDIVHASERGTLVMSNGPFLEVTATLPGANEIYEVGDMIEAPERQIEFDVKVQCPNWLDVNRVFVVVNGRRSAEHDYSRETHPDMFSDGVVKFEQHLNVTVEEDAHIIVVTGGEGMTLGPVFGPDYGTTPPTALTNPFWIDVDGGDWTPNNDTLDSPLPTRRS